MEFKLKPIGVVHTEASDDNVRRHDNKFGSTIEIYPEFEAGLDGMEGFSHILVIGYFHRLRPEQVGPLKVKPRGLMRHGLSLEELPLIGVFALDSPTRPNPIGLSLASLISREGRKLFVSGLDYFDGTPVLDIKPYQGSYRIDQFTFPEWHNELLKKANHV